MAKPVDKDNHMLDALIYATEKLQIFGDKQELRRF